MIPDLQIRSAFFGTPRSAVPTLEVLSQISDLQLVITRPDRARGRSATPQASPVKQAAEQIPTAIGQPADRDDLAKMVARLDVDIAVVAAFGMIIPAEVLDMPARGMINVHFSLLPRWRGAAPVERALLSGDRTTGVSLMQMDAGIDTGGILAQWETAIGADESAGQLTERLSIAGAELLEQRLGAIVSGDLAPEPQDDAAKTYAPMLSSAQARLDFTQTAAQVGRFIRAFNPRPGAHTSWRGARFKIHTARPVTGRLDPGRIEAGRRAVRVGCGSGCVELRSVQPGGSKVMSGIDWARGVRGELDRFE